MASGTYTPAARRARREGKDLVMEVRLTREARYIGGYGQPLTAKARERGDEELGAEDDGTSLLSSGWGNGHDGAGLQVLNAEFVPVSPVLRSWYARGLMNSKPLLLCATGWHCSFIWSAEPIAAADRVCGAALRTRLCAQVGPEAETAAWTGLRGWRECHPGETRPGG